MSHVGFDPEHGFSMENVPDDWKSVFNQAGITQEQLQNKEMATFIYDFMNTNQIPNENEQYPNHDKRSGISSRPPPPSRAPPNAPKRQPPPPPPLPLLNGNNRLSPPTSPLTTVKPSPLPLSSLTTAKMSPIPPPLKSSSSFGSNTSPTNSPPSIQSPRDVLMSSIRSSGIHSLKSTSDNSSPPSSPQSQSHPTDLMANLLKKALEDRSKHMSTVGPSSPHSSDDDW